MKQHQLKTTKKSFTPKLKVVKGLKDQSEAIETLVNTAWGFACTALWNTSVFSNKEIEDAKNIIRGFLIDSKNPEKAYSAFCQRVLLARQYISNNTSKYIPLPTIWLDKQNLFGFAGTKIWYDNIKALRVSLPQFKAELKAFAEAILEMKEYPTEKNFEYWKNYFIERKAPGLLALFLQTIARQQFGL
jgi:hypothetical protein